MQRKPIPTLCLAVGLAYVSAAAAEPLPKVDAGCLLGASAQPLARLAEDGKLTGPPKDHIGPIQLQAPASLPFEKVAAALRLLQARVWSVDVAVAGPGGRRLRIPIRLHSDFACVPLPASGFCAPLFGPARGCKVLVRIGADGRILENRPPPLAISVAVLGEEVELRVRDGRKPVRMPLAALDKALGELRAEPRRIRVYVNATGPSSWQAVVTALAISHCRVWTPDASFDEVVLGSPN